MLLRKCKLVALAQYFRNLEAKFEKNYKEKGLMKSCLYQSVQNIILAFKTFLALSSIPHQIVQP